MSQPTETYEIAAGKSFLCRGISLVELVVFIGIISVGLAGILGVMNFTTRASADPLVQKQALAIAEAYLEEVLAMPFTYCDPDDTAAANARVVGDCTIPDALGIEGPGPETRSGTSPFDNVSDYAALPLAVPANVDGTPIGGLGVYQVAVAVVQEALAANTGTVPDTASLRIRVTVIGPNDVNVVLDGYRTRYAPNALP